MCNLKFNFKCFSVIRCLIMTMQRFLYKVFWKRVGVPLILLCGALATFTSFYHHYGRSAIRSDVRDVRSFRRIKYNSERSNFMAIYKNTKHLSPRPWQADGEGSSEIELQDTFFDDLRKPHVHVAGGLEAVSKEKAKVSEVWFDKPRNYQELNGDVGLVSEKDNLSIAEKTHLNKADKKPTPSSRLFWRRGHFLAGQSGVVQTEHEIKPQNDTMKQQNFTKTSTEFIFVLNSKMFETGDKNGSLKLLRDSDISGKPDYSNPDYIDSFLPADLNLEPKLAPNRLSVLYYDKNTPPETFAKWQARKTTLCSGHFTGYDRQFAVLKHVIVDKSNFKGRKGGEEIKDVLNQAESAEFYSYDMGCFQLSCSNRLDYYFDLPHHLAEYLFNTKTQNVDVKRFDKKVHDLTIVVTRYEYANIYHTMTDWYNAFLLMNFFNSTQQQTAILLVDGHPKGALDDTWSVLFSRVDRVSSLAERTKYSKMVWNIVGYNSMFLQHDRNDLPLMEQFRKFFLQSHGIMNQHSLNCQKVKIVFLWRRDYVAHPRNPSGAVSRKIRNERRLLQAVKRAYKQHYIAGIQIDLFDMQQQLQIISDTDVLIGMHGAGLTHTAFLPKHAALIELVPNYWNNMDHFLSIARWRRLWYERWVNTDPHLEVVPNRSTRIPPGVVTTLLKSVLRKMECISPFEDA